MKLTIINQFYTPDISPTAHLTASLAEHRAQLGDPVTVVASGGGYVGLKGATGGLSASADGPEEFPLADKPPVARQVRIRRVWTPRLGKGNALKRCVDYGCFYLGAMWRMVTMPRQDVVVALTTPPFIAWAGALHKMVHWRKPRPRLVLWNMDCYPEIAERSGAIRKGAILSRLMRRGNRALFRRLDHLVCLDAAMAELLLSSYDPSHAAPEQRGDEGARTSPTVPATVIPNWERASRFPPDVPAPKWDEAESLGLAGRFVVLYLGNAGHGHQFETVIDAAKRLRDEAVTFLFVGGGSRWEAIRQAAEHAGLSNVVLHDYIPKERTPAVMAAADCALITLRDDALGVMSPSKLHANLAMGLPIIYVGPEKSNVDEAITRFDCGVSVRHGEARALTDFIRAAMAEPSRLAALRQRARAAFDEAYCDTQTLPRFDEVLMKS